MLRVLVCDKNAVVRSGLRALLDAEPDIEVVETTDSGLHAMMLARAARPDVVVTGLELLSLSGIELIRRLTDMGPGEAPRIVVYTTANTEDAVSEVLHAGANGLLAQGATREELISAIRTVARGEAMLAPSVAQLLVNWFRCQTIQPETSLSEVVTSLTGREREVLLLLAQGMQPDDIACKLYIGVTTVRTHIYRLRGKLDLKDRAQLVSFAYRAGLMQRT
jgi:DNA-binding NarL/FixJ family response regulator